jgi:hypothetical protein
VIDDTKYPSTKGYSKGFLFSSGFVSRPVKSGDTTGSEVLLSVHIDLRGVSGRRNARCVDALVRGLVELTETGTARSV